MPPYLHGFSDASEKAYAACLYIRNKENLGKIIIGLLCAKTRVALHKKISLPHLELCEAVLLSRLLLKVTSALQTSPSKVYLWTDSTIVLSWISQPPNKWKTFVTNRVTEVLSNTKP